MKEEEIDFVKLFLILWKKKFFILLFVFSVVTVTAIHQCYFVKETFRSDSVILPINSSENASMVSQLGGLASIVGVSEPKKENTIEMILKSRTFAQKIVERFSLVEKWNKTYQETTDAVRKRIIIKKLSKSSGLLLAWEDENPRFAKKMIEYILIEVASNMKHHSENKKSLHLNFLEERVREALKKLNKSENNLKNFQEENQGVDIASQAEAIIVQLNNLKSKKQDQELELSITQKMISKKDGKIKALGLSIAETQLMIERLIGDVNQESYSKSLNERSLLDIPKIGLEYARLLRQVKMNQKIYSLLIEQLEMARIEARKNLESFEIIDPPLEPEKKVAPNITLTVFLSAVVSNVFIVLLLLASHYVRVVRYRYNLGH